jgi:hypothetical protein
MGILLKTKLHFCRWHMLFLFLLSFNAALQLESTEIWFNSLFADNTVSASMQDPLLCGSSHQIKQNSEDRCPATVLQTAAAASTTSSQHQNWVSIPGLLSLLPGYIKSIFKIKNDSAIITDHSLRYSGLSPPLAS